MKACIHLLFASLLMVVIHPSRAASEENWKTYRIGVAKTEIEVSLPYNLLYELTLRDWRLPYRAMRLDWIYSGKGMQEQLFKAQLDIKGPFWIGVYGYIKFFAFVNRKPDWFNGDLFDITALKDMIERNVKASVRMAYEFRFEVVTINEVQWVNWCGYNPKSLSSEGRVRKLDHYVRPLTDDLYLEVAIDLGIASTSNNLEWLKTAEQLRERLKNSLVIRYPIDTKKPHR